MTEIGPDDLSEVVPATPMSENDIRGAAAVLSHLRSPGVYPSRVVFQGHEGIIMIRQIVLPDGTFIGLPLCLLLDEWMQDVTKQGDFNNETDYPEGSEEVRATDDFINDIFGKFQISPEAQMSMLLQNMFYSAQPADPTDEVIAGLEERFVTMPDGAPIYVIEVDPNQQDTIITSDGEHFTVDPGHDV